MNNLAAVVEIKTVTLRGRSRTVFDVLNRNGRGAETAEIGAMISRVEAWGTDTADTLRWRADIIRNGQTDGLDIGALALSVFASQAVFSISTFDETYRRWVAEWEESNRNVGEAIDRISDWIDQGWSDWDVTNNDLHNIQSTLESLSGSELDRVLANLSPTQLQRWVEEMGNSINGFSLDEKQEIFAILATSASGDSLSKVHEAILAGSGGEDAIRFGMAIQLTSPDQVILDFVSYAMASGLATHEFSGLAPVIALGGIEDAATAAAAVRKLVETTDSIELIVADTLAHTGAGASTTPNPLELLVSAIRDAGDSELNAIAFAALAGLTAGGGARLRELLLDRHGLGDTTSGGLLTATKRDDRATAALSRAEPELLGYATELLLDDTNNVIEELATRRDVDGSLTTSYWQMLVDHRRHDDLHAVLGSLRGGDVVDTHRFSAAGTNPGYDYPHARNLAFVAATLNNALREYADESKGDIDAIAWVAGALSFGVGYFLSGIGLVGSVAGTAPDWEVGHRGDTIKDDIDTQYADTARAVKNSLLPSDDPPIEYPGTAIAQSLWRDLYQELHPPG